VIAADGSVDRRKLGSIVFADESARRDLEAIVHPAVYRAIAAGLRAFERTEKPELAVVDVPLLFESGHASNFDKVIATVCPIEMQMARLLERGVSELEARQRLAAQLPSAEKAARADFVVRTDGSFADTDRQVDEVLRVLGGGGHG
jgi:dephospho-CoA kinase